MSSCVLNTEQLKPRVTRVFMLYLLTLLLSVFLFFSTRQCLRTHSSSLWHAFWCFYLTPSLSLVSFGSGVILSFCRYSTSASQLHQTSSSCVLYLKNNYIFPGKNNIFSVLLATDWKSFTQRSGKDVQMYTNTIRTHSALPLHCLVLIAARQSHQSLWAPEGSSLIHRDSSQVHLHNWSSVFPWIPEQVCPPLVSAARTACRTQDGQLWLMMCLFSEAMGRGCDNGALKADISIQEPNIHWWSCWETEVLFTFKIMNNTAQLP